MRTQVLVPLTFVVLAACGGGRQQPAADASPGATPLPLRACESRELTLDSSDIVVQANLDATTGAITVVHASNADARARALEDARKFFGDPHPDARTMTSTGKWGIPSTTDLCGRPVSPAPASPSS